MKVIRAFCLCWLLMLADGVSAQLVDKVLSVLGEDSVGSVTVARTDSDSIQLSLVRQELETARLNEANLRMEMEQMKLAGYAADSVKLALQKQPFYSQMQNAMDNVKALNTTLEMSNELVRIREKSFKEGMATSSDVVDAEVVLSKVKTAFLLAYYQYDVALANLLSICGIPEAFHQYRMDGKTEIL